MTEIPVPANVEPYVRVLGIDLTIAFLTEFGGAELYLARMPQGRSRVARLVGRDKAAALAEAAERLPRRVPLAKRWIAEVYWSKGLSTAEIARRLRSTDVSVRGWLKPAKERQLDLF
ncbi:helix-turn-helix domain-containing protein [Mesorhizobium sp. DCY119]|uniref:helix-turn-helix domain-containing protein n=1 Tax=Mesorhizobium sp. DCY119 TaxID=2108445 RepID=UPI000E6CF62B|nr:helix-turn-helix domain-containing protein [Mesorhizobium sp. DCY119]RJG46458.1 helix-turn-helix domain-containing protein [Mesorhizobium sp. DCY119]